MSPVLRLYPVMTSLGYPRDWGVFAGSQLSKHILGIENRFEKLLKCFTIFVIYEMMSKIDFFDLRLQHIFSWIEFPNRQLLLKLKQLWNKVKYTLKQLVFYKHFRMFYSWLINCGINKFVSFNLASVAFSNLMTNKSAHSYFIIGKW